RITHVVFRFLTHTLYLSLDTHVLTRFFISEPTSTDIYTLSLHDALPILSITSTPERVSSPEPRSAKRSLIRSGRVACKVNRACSAPKGRTCTGTVAVPTWIFSSFGTVSSAGPVRRRTSMTSGCHQLLTEDVRTSPREMASA